MRKYLLASAMLLSPSLAPAQDAPTDMQRGLSMLQTGVAQVLDQHGIDADVDSLTLSQIAQIRNAVQAENDANVKQRIEVILQP